MSQERPPPQAEQLLSALLQQVHESLRDLLKQQNDRIARLETQLGHAVSDIPAVPEDACSVRLQTLDDSSTAKTQSNPTAHFDTNGFSEIMAIWPDPTQAIQTSIVGPSSWVESMVTHYVEPSPLPFMSKFPKGTLIQHPDWHQWFQSRLWAPADRRLPLAFDVDHLNQCSSITEALSKYQALHEFNERLCNSNGRLLIIDNNTFGENRVFGNLVEKKGWRRGFLSNRYHIYSDNDGNRLSRPIDAHGLTHIPPMAWTTIDGVTTGTRPVAPWRRLIIIEGLVGIRPMDYRDIGVDYGLEGFWAEPGHDHTFKEFLKASVQAFSSRDGYTFQYSWFCSISLKQMQRWSAASPKSYEMFKLSGETEDSDLSWIRLLKVGKLYGSSESVIGRDAYYFKMTYSDNSDKDAGQGMNNYWSAVVFRRPSWKGSTSMLPIFHAQLQVLSHSNEALSCVIDDTTKIVNHITSLLDIGDEVLLDPERHDNLLFDDEVFSRSRTYWWTLNMLNALQQSLTQTLALHQEIWDTVIEPLEPIENWPLGVPNIIRKDKVLVKMLVELQNRIKLQHEHAEALRSGLFNASGVVESRASTRLGEIVKLLTYVSIFYLPLTFSTSLWSTTDAIRTLDTAVLFGVMVTAAVLTYATVFNLNNITRAIYRQYDTAKKPWVKKMKEEHKKAWNDRAEQYNGFKIKRFDTFPSEWYVVWYIITWPIRHYLLSIASQILGGQTKSQQPPGQLDRAKTVDESDGDFWLKDHPPFPPSEDVTQAPWFPRFPPSSNAKPREPEISRPPRLSKLFALPRFRRKASSVPATEEQQPAKHEV